PPVLGTSERWFEQKDLAGWTAITVPHNWNATDATFNKSSVGWYRKELKLPRAPTSRERKLELWKVRFEGANYRTKVWLNGKVVGGQVGYFPFEVDLAGLKKGRNTLVAQVSSLRSNTDLTHWRPAAFNGFGSGGWWNFGGLLREVYVRHVDTVDVEDVHVLPRLRRARGPAKVEVRTELRNVTSRDRDVTLVLNVAGQRIFTRPQTVEAGARRELSTSFTIERPKLWQPGRPRLYKLSVAAITDGERKSTYRVNFGVKKIDVDSRGRLLLNGRRLNLRGASIHEDDKEEGGALSPGTRRLLVRRLRDLGGTVTRSHYPLHPAFLEAFDRAGILYWVQAPVYQLPNAFWGRVNRAAQRAALLTVRNNMNHASILTWSLANEPGGNRSELGVLGPALQSYIKNTSEAVRAMDDTHLVAIDRQSRVAEPLTAPAYRYLDALGVNEYFGWYDSYRADLVRPPTTLAELPGYLDALHAANPRLPLVITEFGAEASRRGPLAQPGSEEFQRKFVTDHLAVHASKPYVYGSIHWALRDFRVDTTWQGGAPAAWATPPWHNKSLINEDNGRKLAYFAVKQLWRKTRPLR
ncbi:MAG TPA: glycoside hydrolase family 2 TIM barrel-domain containing protein, partial [Thermoleophilaceae bacterium]|nr:glycoside hydrolase family 2 TIM barrel-domain containing protein [Thermoleophilaceae bacterium]